MLYFVLEFKDVKILIEARTIQNIMELILFRTQCHTNDPEILERRIYLSIVSKYHYVISSGFIVWFYNIYFTHLRFTQLGLNYLFQKELMSLMFRIDIKRNFINKHGKHNTRQSRTVTNMYMTVGYYLCSVGNG